MLVRKYLPYAMPCLFTYLCIKREKGRFALKSSADKEINAFFNVFIFTINI